MMNRFTNIRLKQKLKGIYDDLRQKKRVSYNYETLLNILLNVEFYKNLNVFPG